VNWPRHQSLQPDPSGKIRHADNVMAQDASQIAIEAIGVRNWYKSMRNPAASTVNIRGPLPSGAQSLNKPSLAARCSMKRNLAALCRRKIAEPG
jgi:hypothetical protein